MFVEAAAANPQKDDSAGTELLLIVIIVLLLLLFSVLKKGPNSEDDLKEKKSKKEQVKSRSEKAKSLSEKLVGSSRDQADSPKSRTPKEQYKQFRSPPKSPSKQAEELSESPERPINFVAKSTTTPPNEAKSPEKKVESPKQQQVESSKRESALVPQKQKSEEDIEPAVESPKNKAKSPKEEVETAREKSKKGPATPPVRVMLNEWFECRVGDPFPTGKCVQALDRPLDTLPGEDPIQFVALWYKDGEPVMGRVWKEDGKIAADFSWGGHEYRNKTGTVIQILLELPEHIRGFDYSWQDFPDAASFDEKEWHPVHVDQWKGDISPGVLIVDGKEVLGKVDVRNERASIGYAGAERLLVGLAVHSCKVLCRKAKPGCKFD